MTLLILALLEWVLARPGMVEGAGLNWGMGSDYWSGDTWVLSGLSFGGVTCMETISVVPMVMVGGGICPFLGRVCMERSQLLAFSAHGNSPHFLGFPYLYLERRGWN